MKRRAAPVVAAVIGILVVGCTNNPPSPPASPPSTTAAADAWTRSVPPAAAGAGSHHVLDGCDQARSISDAFPVPTDVVVGPLSYSGLKASGADPIREPNSDNGGYFYKTGAQLRSGVSVTVTIADEAADYAAIVTESGPAEGSRSVTYQSCTTPSTGGFWWVGGFLLRNRNSACLPIDVTTPGDPNVRRVVIALGAGNCH